MPAPTNPGRLDWRAYRWAPFIRTIDIAGVDLTGCTLTAQVRDYRDAPGAALVDLGDAGAGAQGLSFTTASSGGIVTSTIKIQINETTIEALRPFPANGLPRDSEVKLAWALHISGPGFPKARWLEGDFTIVPGANQA